MSKIKIHIISKPEFNDIMANNNLNDDNIGDSSIALISINDTMGQWAVSWFDKDHHNVLRLWFDDVENDLETSPTNPHECRAFTDEQAKAVFEFIETNKSRNFLVHCSAGISRSGAVGRFILDYLDGDKEHFEKYNKHILPNARVSKKLNKLGWQESSEE